MSEGTKAKAEEVLCDVIGDMTTVDDTHCCLCGCPEPLKDKGGHYKCGECGASHPWDKASAVINALTAHIMDEVKRWQEDAEAPINRIAQLERKVSECAEHLSSEVKQNVVLARRVAEQNGRIAELERKDADRVSVIAKTTKMCVERDRRIAELERDATNRCDECGSKLIDNCGVCGAPTCCPSCCRVNTLGMVIKKKDDRIAELERQLATARGLLERGVVPHTVDEHNWWRLDTRVFLAAKEGDNG